MSFDARILTGVGVLAAVTETGNFARAAEALGLTPSGVSRAVARLEARVGVRLFDRTPRSVTLTGEGRRFHAQVIALLAGIEEAATEAAGAACRGSSRPVGCRSFRWTWRWHGSIRLVADSLIRNRPAPSNRPMCTCSASHRCSMISRFTGRCCAAIPAPWAG